MTPRGAVARFWPSVGAIYTGAWRFARAAPLAFLLPAIVEFAQHVVEARTGFYTSRSGARAAANDAGRLAWGYAKTLALLPPGYWFARFLAFGDARKAVRPELPAIGLFAVQFAIMAALQFYGLFGPPIGTLFGLSGKAATIAGVVVAVVQSVVGIYLTAWFVAWPLGNRAIGPIRSFAVMHGSFWRAVGYLLAGMLPLMVLHYALGLGAIGRPGWLTWPMLVIDALIVAFLALTLAGGGYMAARDGAARRGVPLLP